MPTTSEPAPPKIPPTPVVRRAVQVRNRLRRLADSMLPPQGIAVERAFLIAEIKMLGVACELSVAESIDAGADDANTIARRAGADPDSIERMMRFLASRGWFVRRRNGTYRLNARSRALRADDPQSLRGWFQFMSADWTWDLLNHLPDSVRTGTSSARLATDRTFFDWVHAERPDAGATFDAAMHSLSSVAGPLVLRAVELDGVTSLCDVGGGTGRMLRAFLEAQPALTGTVVDLADVVVGAPDVLGDIAHRRWSTVGGDFFQPDVIPGDHDRYLLQAIMHDWGDDAAGQILDNLRAAMPRTSRAWIVDSILDPDERDDMSKAVDILMLALTEGGRERTQSEWDRLFANHGFRIEHQTQLPLLIWVFTIAPV
ncbi:MAG TPA: methyltransferase [Microthrixaceae bacterium]|nr:methyltransferase [Microthrixaceae bacterium]